MAKGYWINVFRSIKDPAKVEAYRNLAGPAMQAAGAKFLVRGMPSKTYELGLMEALSIEQTECFAAAIQFARTEGIVPAPEPTHALAATIREALACRETGEEKVIVTALCGHGLLDLAAYDAYLGGRMVDSGLSDQDLAAALAAVPVLAG